MSQVLVSVVNNEVVVNLSRLSMLGKGIDALIQWDLVTPGWTFPDNGIVIDDNLGEFTRLHVVDEGRKFWCFDRNSDGKTYKYSVNVTNGQTTLTLDPTI